MAHMQTCPDCSGIADRNIVVLTAIPGKEHL